MRAVSLRRGAILAGYRIEGVIGAGRMGAVYRATQLALDRPVALRVLAPDLAAEPSFRDRFRHEALLQARLEHPHILPVYEVGEAGDSTFLAMRLVRGRSLKRLLGDEPLRPAQALDVLAQVASALDAAHDAGLIHRGIRPQAILVDDSGHAYLTDFGLAKVPGEYGLTQADRDVTSLDYVSPEQIRQRRATRSSDLYGFAAVLFEALAGEVPFARASEAARYYAHLSEPPPPLSERRRGLPQSLDGVIARGLAKNPADRYPTASELVAAARATLVGERRRIRFRARRDRRRVPTALLVGAAALVPVLAIFGFQLGDAGRRAEPPRTAQVASGPLALAVPAAWTPLAAPRGIAGLGLDDPVVVAWREQGEHGEVWAGMAPGEGPLLLPSRFVRRLVRPPRAENVRLGELPAVRYRGLRHRGLEGALTLYVVPTDLGTATVACLQPDATPREGGPTPLERCERIAGTLSLRGARPQRLGPSPAYGAALGSALAELDRARARTRSALARARTPRAQARAARAVAGAFRAAAAAVARAEPALVERPAHRALQRALKASASAYTALAQAAGRRDAAGYRRAAVAVAGAEGGVARALRTLAAAGYRVAS